MDAGISLVSRICKEIEEKTGIIIRDDRLMDMEIVLNSRFKKTGLQGKDYLSFFKNDKDEIIYVASQFTIQESCFFRYREHFDRIKYIILPELISKKTERRLTILSAGCATGEEPYSLAMLVNELIPDHRNWQIQIIATDINLKALEIAKEGLYSNYKLRNTDDYYREKYFKVKMINKQIYYQICDLIRAMVKFRHCNLISEPFELADLIDVDIILCENVIIYFNQESIKRLINNFYKMLVDGGYLFLGYSETLNFVENKFNLSWWKNSFAYQKSNLIKNKEIENIKKLSFKKITYLSKKNNEDMQLPAAIDYSIYCNLLTEFKVLIEEGNLKQAEKILALLVQAVQFHKEEYFLLKAEYHYLTNDYFYALEESHRALRFNPYLLEAHLILAIVYLKVSMLQNADFEIRTSLYMQPECALSYYLAACYWQKCGDFNKKKEFLIKAKTTLINHIGRFNFSNFPKNKVLIQKILSDIHLGRISDE